jgi:hypothetical protein
MPYYFGEDSPGWDEYMQRLEAENLARGPLERFTYMEPWEAKASVLRFSVRPAHHRGVKLWPTQSLRVAPALSPASLCARPTPRLDHPPLTCDPFPTKSHWGSQADANRMRARAHRTSPGRRAAC